VTTAEGAELLDTVHATLAAFWAEHPVPDADRFRFELAAGEVAANIVEHAGAGVTASFELAWHDGTVVGTFLDDGAPVPEGLVESAELPDQEAEGGRGLAVARECLDALTHERVEGRNRWVLVRRVSTA
jgi:serine/threonine-protein kinase RsbW